MLCFEIFFISILLANRQCQAVLLNDFLLVGDTRSSLGLTSNLYQISLSTGSMTSLLSAGADNPVGVAFDDVRMDVYWTDVSQKTLNRISLKNRTTSVIYTDVLSIMDGITLDPGRQKIYYTDARADGQVCEVSMDGTNQRVITWSVNSQPRAILVDTSRNILYWSDWSSVNPGIFSSAVSGDSSQLQQLISGNLLWPNALAIDFAGQMMYWGDSGLHTIEMSNLDGSGRTLIASDLSSRYYGFSLSPTYVYITDWTNSSIRKLNRQTLQLSTHFTQSLIRPNGIVYYSSNSTTIPTSTTSTTTTTTTRTTASSSSTTTTTPSTTTITPSLLSTTTTIFKFWPPDFTSSTTTSTMATTPPKTSNLSQNQSSNIDQTTVIIIGVVVGGVILVVVIVTLGIVCTKWRSATPAAPMNSTYQPYSVSTLIPPPPPTYEHVYDSMVYNKDGDYTEIVPASNEYTTPANYGRDSGIYIT